jgi:hypothetical protein
MAANDYYTSPYPKGGYEDYRNAPLPPVPRTYTSSPYSSQTHLPQPYSPSYQSTSGKFQDDDPYEDNNSIPLSGRKKHESATSIAPMLPHQQEDPFVRDADPTRERKSRGRRKDGWFTGQITWVVYTLTVIQLAVFIAELVKNGEIALTQQ